MKLAPLIYPKKEIKKGRLAGTKKVNVMYYNNGPVKKNINNNREDDIRGDFVCY